MTESVNSIVNDYKIIDNSFLQKYDVKLYRADHDMHDIIDDFLKDNSSENPFYIIDLGEIIKSYSKWVRLLPEVKPYYAVKCNTNHVLLETLAKIGVNFDCASESEMKTIIEITKDPLRIIFANPCKMSSQISYARANGIDYMTFDCEEELYKIKLYHPNAKILLRIAVDDSKSLCKFNIKYGCKLKNVEDVLTIAKTIKLDVVGFSFHVGSGCHCSEIFYEALRDCKTAVNIAKTIGINIKVIDIGGGFPGLDKQVKFEDIAKRINDGINDFFFDEMEWNNLRFIAEPGRYFAEKTHTLVLNVIGKKIVTDDITDEKLNVYYLNDGIYGSFSCIFFDHINPTILPFADMTREHQMVKSRFFGPTCDSLDLIVYEIMFPELAISENVYVENFGAYTIASSSNFNGFKTNIFKYIFRS